MISTRIHLQDMDETRRADLYAQLHRFYVREARRERAKQWFKIFIGSVFTLLAASELVYLLWRAI